MLKVIDHKVLQVRLYDGGYLINGGFVNDKLVLFYFEVTNEGYDVQQFHEDHSSDTVDLSVASQLIGIPLTIDYLDKLFMSFMEVI